MSKIDRRHAMVGIPLAFAATSVAAATDESSDRLCFDLAPEYSLHPLRFDGKIGMSSYWEGEISFFIRESVPYGVAVIAVEDRGATPSKFNQGLGEALLVVDRQRVFLDSWVEHAGVKYSKNVLYVRILAKKWYGGDTLQPDLGNVHETYYDSLPAYTKGVKYQAFIHTFGQPIKDG